MNFFTIFRVTSQDILGKVDQEATFKDVGKEAKSMFFEYWDRFIKSELQTIATLTWIVIMSIFRMIGMILFAIGGILLVLGIVSTQQFGQKVAEVITGHYTSNTVIYIIGGIVLIIGGLGIARSKR